MHEDRVSPLPNGILSELAATVAVGGDTNSVNRISDEADDEGERYACNCKWNDLHMPWESNPEMAMPDKVRDTLSRPAFFRTYRVISGIDNKARTIAVQTDSPCPFCKERFRNPGALKMHMEERHGASVEQIDILVKDTSVKCSRCGMPFDDWRTRRDHERTCY